MTSSLSSRLARAGLLAGLMTLTAGTACVQEQDFLIIKNAVWFDTSCVLSTSANPPLLVNVDVKFDSDIAMGFVISNTQTQNQNSNTGIDDTEIQLEGAEVTLSFSGGAVSPSSFEVPIPTDSISGGGETAALIHLPSEISQSLRATMSALPAGSVEHLEMEVIFTGHKAGQVGNTKIGLVESRPFTFPFEICYGCLENCDCGTCPTETEWEGSEGSCGFAQRGEIVHPTCAAP